VKRDIGFWVSENGICLIEGWTRNGLSEYAISRKMGISVKRIKELKDEYKAIAKALERGREVVDLQVEDALLKKALTGDFRACTFWLKNRVGGVWKDGGSRKLKIEVSKIDEEIEELLDEASEERKMEG